MADDSSLFAGAVPYYARYRRPYPDTLVADLVAHCRLDGRGRLLDLGCGPGTLTFPLAQHFEGALAIDADGDMIAEARRIGGGENAGRIAWEVGRAEDLPDTSDHFRLVTAGSSFHWMDRDAVLAKARALLEPDGRIALAAGLRAWWDGAEDWHQVITRVVQSYLGPVRKAGRSGFAQYTGKQELFEETLERSGWKVELNRDYPVMQEWDIDSIIGFLWSSSFAARPHFGARVHEFERELRGELSALRPDGQIHEEGLYGLVIGSPPGR